MSVNQTSIVADLAKMILDIPPANRGRVMQSVASFTPSQTKTRALRLQHSPNFGRNDFRALFPCLECEQHCVPSTFGVTCSSSFDSSAC